METQHVIFAFTSSTNYDDAGNGKWAQGRKWAVGGQPWALSDGLPKETVIKASWYDQNFVLVRRATRFRK